MPECDCGWLRCKEYSVFFDSLPNDVRGGAPIHLKLDPKSAKDSTLRKGIVHYTEVPLSSCRNKILYIARHHYDPKILALFDENEKARSATFSASEHEKYSAVQDATFNHSKGGSIEYFLLPCMEESVVAEYVDGKTEVDIVERKTQHPIVKEGDSQLNGDAATTGQPARHRSSIRRIASSGYHEYLTIDFEAMAQDALSELQSTYGTAALEKQDVAFLMDGWNKILGWETMWKEALWFRWRILVAREELQKPSNDDSAVMGKAEAAIKARHLVEKNNDPIAICFGDRTHDGKNLLLALFDEQVRSLCPHKQTVQREAYRNVSDDRGAALGLSLECTTSKEIFRLFSTLGIQPSHYLSLCEAFLYTMGSHSPYAQDNDVEDLKKAPNKSAYARFVAQLVAKPGIKDTLSVREKFAAPLYSIILPKFWKFVKIEGQGRVGELFYSNLLSTYPELLNYFARADMDSLAGHIILAVDLMVKYPEIVGVSNSSFRKVMKHLGDIHRELGVPTDAYPMIGMSLIATFKPSSEQFAEMTKGTDMLVTQEELEKAFVGVFGPTMSFTFYPMLREERTVAKAAEFFEQVAEELDWTPAKLSKRMLEVKLEIASTGTYQHTTEELQLGARLAWRNSTKCIGRISWNTLEVRDCRHVDTPEGIVHEIEKHLEIATAGTNLQSVMTVFRPRGHDEPWGIRFWSDQLVRYACYIDKDDPTKTMGDTANKHFTKFLIEKGLWTPPPPEKRTQHDVLPIVFKMPGRDEPYVHQFDDKYVDEVSISHPEYPEVSRLGHRWAAVPAISSFNVNIGGVDYGCMPFNGWFASVEIVRDLMERYPGANEKWAKAIGIDTSKRMWKSRIAHEIDVAVLHSFDEQGYTIVDMDTVGEQFMTHCKREQEAGRECPAQWSWIGGLTGPTNPTWHKEMRDFRVEPVYEYCCEMWGVTGEDEDFPDGEGDSAAVSSDTDSTMSGEEEFTIPRVVIAFGSETGTAEAAAGRLARALRLCKPIVSSLNKVAGLDIIKQRKATHLIVLCSTFGKGQPPSNATTFFETEIPDGILDNTKVAVLCLGSSMYPDFCQAGKTVNKLLANAGAQMMAPATTADEAVDSAGTIAQWLKLMKTLVLPDSLEAAIEARMGVANEPLKYKVKWQFENTKTKSERYVWPVDKSSLCLMNEELLVGGDITKRSTRRIGFEVPHGTSYISGDHLAVNPLNSMELVYRFAACFASEFRAAAASQGVEKAKTKELLDYMLQQRFEVDCIDNGQAYPAQMCFEPTTLAEVLQVGISLSISESSAGDLIAVLKKHVPSDGPLAESNDTVKHFNELSGLILEGGKGSVHQDAMNSFLSLYPTVVDLLETFVPIVEQDGNSETIPLADILAILPRLQPRLYSISSSSITSPTIVEISVGVVHAHTNDGVHIAGVCSNYLARLKPMHDRACISIRTSSFRFPDDIVNTPMIMVGAGTGLAPMIGFLEDRASALENESEEKKTDKRSTNCHLFFGCRTHDERIYRKRIEDWEQRDVLNLHLALSRSPDRRKMYVQDMIKEKGDIICDLLLRDDCTYYICGDANMADFVYDALVEVLRENANISRVKATNLLKRMRVENRWQYDLWGISSYMDDDSYSIAKRSVAKRKANRALSWLSSIKRKTHQWEDEDGDDSF